MASRDSDERREFAEIANESLHFVAAGLVIGSAKNRRRMYGGHDVGSERRFEKFAAMLSDAKVAPEEGLGGGCTEADDHFGFERGNFRFEPGTAGGDFGGVWLFVDAALAARFPLEMLHCVGDVNFLAVDARFGEGGVEKFACRADEGKPFEVFLITGLFADEHDFRGRTAVAEDGLGGALPEVAILAVFCSASEFFEGGVERDGRIC